MSSIAEHVFELADQYVADELEELIDKLKLLVHGKKSLEADKGSPAAPAPAKKAAASKTTQKSSGSESSDSSEDDPF
jgi:hypothetical protein